MWTHLQMDCGQNNTASLASHELVLLVIVIKHDLLEITHLVRCFFPLKHSVIGDFPLLFEHVVSLSRSGVDRSVNINRLQVSGIKTVGWLVVMTVMNRGLFTWFIGLGIANLSHNLTIDSYKTIIYNQYFM